MDTIRELMLELEGADPERVNRLAMERGSLPVRLAMLGLASARKSARPLWWGYPPGVFISYKWAGEPMRRMVTALAGHVRELGYRAYLDVEHLDDQADAYFQIPQFIVSLQDCSFYLMLLTESSLRFSTASEGKTTWIHEEYQHAVRLVNAGRLIMVPVLLDEQGMPDFLTREQVIDLTSEPRDFDALNDILAPDPLALPETVVAELEAIVTEFDQLFLGQGWDEAAAVLHASTRFAETFDHQFRQMLHALYTADGERFEWAFERLTGTYGQAIVLRLYHGYCAAHGIPERIQTGG